MDKIDWKGKNVLVTGAEGFIGCHIAKALADKGARVSTIVRDQKKEGTIELFDVSINRIKGDIANYADCERAINEYDIEFVFHIAAQAIVGPANRSPLSTFEANIKGTWNILEACRVSSTVKGIIVASSDKAYGQQKKLPYTEDSPLNGYYPYDASKACADLLCTSYYKTYGLPVCITRNANTYGPGDVNMSRIIPEVITTILKGEQPIIRSDGSPERDYMYIGDAVDSYLTLAEHMQDKKLWGEAFNFGSGTPVSVLELYKAILSEIGSDQEPKIMGEAKHEIDRQYLDSSKAKQLLGWECKVSLSEGISKTIAWYKENLKHFS